MMNDTKEILKYLERATQEELEEVVENLKNEGFTTKVRTQLRSLQERLSNLSSATHFYDAWHSDNL